MTNRSLIPKIYRRASTAHQFRVWCAVHTLLFFMAAQATLADTSGTFNVRDYGAVGNGETLDTPAINKAIDACTVAGGGQVFLPPGKYLSGTVHLKNHVTLFLEAGAVLIGTPDINQYQYPVVPEFMPEARWGKWHRALILGEGLEDITIAGQGIIDGNKVFDPTGEEHMRGPHAFLFANCHKVTVRDVSFEDAANYAIFFEASSQVEIRNVKITGGWDGVHFRGAPNHPCRDVSITGCQFFTGDDSMAGRYWDNTLICDCIVNSSCNGIRLIGPATHLIIHNCLFYGPGVHPHRTSNRHNMLAGINLQPGGWDATKGALDDVMISDVTMHNVATPFFFTLKSGNTAGNIIVDRVTATGVYRAASSVESWAETGFTNVVFRDVTIEYKGGGTLEDERMEIKSPGVDARPLPAWGFYTRNVQNLQLDNVRLRFEKEDLRPVLICTGVDQLVLDGFKFPLVPQAPEAMVLNDTNNVQLHDVDFNAANPRCTELNLVPNDTAGRFISGKPFEANVVVENGGREGLVKIELDVAGQKNVRWLWLHTGEIKEVLLKDLNIPEAGNYEVRCGDITRNLRIER
jgi:hypothetical protein